MKCLLLSEGGDGCGLALRLKLEGHDARLWIRDPACASYGHGLVDHASEYSFGQTVIADCTGLGVLMDKFRDDYVPTFGGSCFADKLEADRVFAEQVFKDAGIPVPESERVENWDDAEELIERIGENSQRVVLKPEGHLAGILPSYVSYDLEDAKKTLEHWKTQIAGDNAAITIQEFVEGIAISTEGFFNGREWIPGLFNHTIERKQLMNEDLGPSGGCTGNLIWRCSWDDPLVRDGLLRLTPLLEERRYTGSIDINAVVNEKGFFALEFTPRFGFDSFPTTLCALCDFDFGAFMEACARGYDTDVSLKEGFAAGVRVTIPPWPDESAPTNKHIPIAGLEREDWQNFYPYDMQLNEHEELETAGGYGIVGVANGFGDSITEAFARAYMLCRKLRIPNKQYRTDLDSVCLADYRKVFAEDSGWVGVDLDKTLSKYRSGQKSIGEPIEKMVARVRRMIANGKEVRVMTARAAGDERHENIAEIAEWVKEHIGTPLEVTSVKDFQMVELFDDRATEVEANTGELVG